MYQQLTRKTSVGVSYYWVEGGIGSGKSTLLKRLESRLRTKGLDNLVVVQEPLHEWVDVNGHNLLQAFYDDKNRWAYTFQVHAMSTRVKAVRTSVTAAVARRKDELVQARDLDNMIIGMCFVCAIFCSMLALVTTGGPNIIAMLLGFMLCVYIARILCREQALNSNIIVLCERSIFTDKHIFVEALAREKSMSDAEVQLYGAAFDFFSSFGYPGYAAGLIYLRTNPETCAKHIKARERSEECNIPLHYLSILHELHEDVIVHRRDTWGGAPRLVIDVETLGDLPNDDVVADKCAEQVFDFIMKVEREKDTKSV